MSAIGKTIANLERQVYGVSAGAGEEEREGDDEDQEVEDHVSLEHLFHFPLDVELCAGREDEEEGGDLGIESNEEHDTSNDLESGV